MILGIVLLGIYHLWLYYCTYFLITSELKLLRAYQYIGYAWEGEIT